MSRDGPGLLLRDILKDDPQVVSWSKVVASVSPDVLVIGDMDYDVNGVALRALADRLDDYPYQFTARPNRGRDSGRDLNGNGLLDEPEDAIGYGEFSGQGGMAVLSRLPILDREMRDFSDFAWADLPGSLAIGDGRDPTQLSTTVHWDLPVLLPNGGRMDLLIWHGTAPVFDGPEDRNGKRNHDETLFWQYHIDGAFGDPPEQAFLLMGTANADPRDGESLPHAIAALLAHPMLRDVQPSSLGGVEAAARDGGINAQHQSSPSMDTVDWPEDHGYPGNLRVDYVLPSRFLNVSGSGVFWPEGDALLSEDVARASRHRLIWLDVEMSDGGLDRR